MANYKICLDCREHKELSEFTPKKGCVGGVRETCKKCTSFKTTCRQTEKKAEISPQNYMMCDDCDRTFYKYTKKSTSPYAPLKRAVLTACKFCGSDNIIDY